MIVRVVDVAEGGFGQKNCGLHEHGGHQCQFSAGFGGVTSLLLFISKLGVNLNTTNSSSIGSSMLHGEAEYLPKFPPLC